MQPNPENETAEYYNIRDCAYPDIADCRDCMYQCIADDDSFWDDDWDLDPYDDDMYDYNVYGDDAPARFWECKACDGGRFVYGLPCEACGDTGLRWWWLRMLAGTHYWLRAYHNRIFVRCPMCRRLEFVAGKRVGEHDDCLPF